MRRISSQSIEQNRAYTVCSKCSKSAHTNFVWNVEMKQDDYFVAQAVSRLPLASEGRIRFQDGPRWICAVWNVADGEFPQGMFSLPGFEQRFAGRPARSLSTVPP